MGKDSISGSSKRTEKCHGKSIADARAGGAGLPKAANQEAGDVSRASHRFRKRGAAAQIVRDSKGKA